jgi:hypothetical protein
MILSDDRSSKGSVLVVARAIGGTIEAEVAAARPDRAVVACCTLSRMQPWEQSRIARVLGPAGFLLSCGVSAVLLAVVGSGPRGEVESSAAWNVLAVLWHVLSSGPVVCAYLLGAWGLGRVVAEPIARASSQKLWLQLGAGLALMLTLSHLLGQLGLLSGPGVGPRVVGWGVVAIGLGLLGHQVLRGPLRPERWPVMPRSAALWGPAVAMLCVAASNPPGWLWASEFGAYDVLSYHLQLPREWVTGDRLSSLHHNVYSFLPSYVEAAFLHLGSLMSGPGDPNARLMGSEAEWVIACQMLHAGIGAVAGFLTARACALVIEQSGLAAGGGGWIGSMTGLMVVATPWTVVVSTLAYNEAAVLALGAGGVLAALDARLSPQFRGGLTGLMCAAAVSAKPTAAFLAVPLVGVLLLSQLPVRAWWRAVVPGSVVGLCVLTPWLVRNAMSTGNPVFPFAHRVLGQGHWDVEQLERYAANHRFSGDGVDRLHRLVSSEFGLLHPQFAMASALLVVGAGLAIAGPSTRRTALLIVGAVAMQLLGWLALTHLQSRFLIPLLTPIALLWALGSARLVALAGAKRATRVAASGLVMLVPIFTMAWSIASFSREGGGRPNEFLAAGPGSLSGMVSASAYETAEPELRERFLANASPIVYLNLEVRPQDAGSARVYLLGDGAPLYVYGATGSTKSGLSSFASPDAGMGPPVVYHTTWDASPLGEEIEVEPDDPRAWTRGLRSQDIRLVLVNIDELRRLIVRDRYFDQRVTMARLDDWLASPGVSVVRRWPRDASEPASSRISEGTGYLLLRLDEPGEGANDQPRLRQSP